MHQALFLTVTFGGFHGLIFLPVMLSLFMGNSPGAKTAADADTPKATGEVRGP